MDGMTTSAKDLFRSGRILPWMAALLLSAMAARPADAAKKWRDYPDCVLRESGGNDGDSFHVTCTSLKSSTARHKLIRLYFVDTPESEGSLPERLEVQREYWDLPDHETVVKCGKMAHKFTEDFLKKGFTVHSRLADALGRSNIGRDYGMIEVGGQDLGYALVRNGLARVFGKGTDLTELDEYKKSENDWWRKLRVAEAEAKREKLGCWAYSSGGTPGRTRLALPSPAAAATAVPAAPAHRAALPPSPPPRTTAPAAAGSLAAATQSRIGAMTAPRQVAAQDVVLARPVLIGSAEPPYSAMGQLRAGVTVHVVEGLTPDRARVTFTTSSGKTYEGSARFADLGI